MTSQLTLITPQITSRPASTIAEDIDSYEVGAYVQVKSGPWRAKQEGVYGRSHVLHLLMLLQIKVFGVKRPH